MIACFIVQNVRYNFIKIISLVGKIFVKVRRHLSAVQTKIAKNNFYSQNVYYKENYTQKMFLR